MKHLFLALALVLPLSAGAFKPEHLKYLKRTNECPNCDLYKANLRGAKLWEANLKGVNLRSADLSGAYLENTNLEYADLEYANLEGANLKDANLGDANLEGANRLGGNGVAESTVFGGIAGDVIAKWVQGVSLVAPEDSKVRETVARCEAPLLREEGPSVFALRDRLRETMWRKAGVVRDHA